MGHGHYDLPESLESLPKHTLAPTTLADAIIAIQMHTELNVSVHMQYCAIDLLCWIHYHWNGLLEISADNRIIFREQMGNISRALTVMVWEPVCPANCGEDENHIDAIRIATLREGMSSLTHVLYEGSTSEGPIPVHESGYRSKIYDVRNPFAGRYLELNNIESKTAQRNAQGIVRSIVETQVTPTSTALALRIDFHGREKFRWWMKNAPSLLQLNLSAAKASKDKAGKDTPDEFYIRPIYDPDRLELRPEDSDVDSETSDTDVADVIQLYPEILDALEVASQRCTCGCTYPVSTLKGGCLQSLMYSQVILLVGHAMAESSGAVDVSNLRSGTSGHSLISATTRFLDNIANQGLILWGDWFRLVATAITGLPSDLGIKAPADDAGEIMCWVAGSMSVVPTWLALDQDIKLAGSWSVKTLIGCPLGVTAEKAIIKPQATNPAHPIQTTELEEASHEHQDTNEEPKMESAVISNHGSCFRIMTLVKTEVSLRCLNPNEVYKGHIHAVRPICLHGTSKAPTVYPWTLSQILQSWEKANALQGHKAHIGFVGSSILARNIAIGLAGEGCVLQGSKCCSACFVKAALTGRKIGIAYASCEASARPKQQLLRSI